MKINYVISTYNGKNNRRSGIHPSPGEILKSHLKKINTLKHNLSQITIVKPESDNFYSDYYDINLLLNSFSIPIKIIECRNYGFSGGQFLKAYETYLDKFDYYLFIEDDYCPNIDNFDKFLLSTFKSKFIDNKGILCSIVLGEKSYEQKEDYPLHWDGIFFTSLQTLQILYSNPLFKNDPRKWLNHMELLSKKGYISFNFGWKAQKDDYLGAYYQLAFSQLFSLSNIKHKDYLNVVCNKKLCSFPFWLDMFNHVVWFNQNLDKQGTTQNSQISTTLLSSSPFIPIQLSTPKGISEHLI